MATIPQRMCAVKVCGAGDVRVEPSAPLPSLRADYLLIRVFSVALNPTDWKGVAFFGGSEPHTIGCDAAGRVVQCGDHVAERFKPGDRVAGLCYGNRVDDPTSGAFGEYALLKADLTMPVPDHVSDAEAATIPVGVNAIGQGEQGFGFCTSCQTNTSGTALYQTLKLPLPSIRDTTPPIGPIVLIYGAATATGLIAVQFARQSGCRVLATCSPRNFQLVKALGAHKVFDYHDAKTCAADIRTATDNNLCHVFDCFSEGSSLQICADALTPRSDVAIYTAMLPVAGKFPRQDVQHGWTSGYTAFGEDYHFLGKSQPAKPKDHAFATMFWPIAGKLLQQDRLRLGPLVHSRQGGLAAIPNGLVELKSGQVSAGKLVYLVGCCC